MRLLAFLIFQLALMGADAPLRIDTKNLLITVDAASCRWSAEVKGTPMRLNDVYFLPGNDASGWKVVSSLTRQGPASTVTLRGAKLGQLDFEYQISAAETGTDILVSLGRSNNTGKAVDVVDMDYFVSSDARLGGTSDRWISLGTRSRNRDYYELWPVIHLMTPQMYEVNHVVRDMDSGNSLLVGHVTTLKGASRFEIGSAMLGKAPDRMRVRGYCSYKVTMPAGKSFPGEKLLISFNADAVRAMEHQADLIANAHDIRLKQRRPIDLDDRELVANNYSRYHSWMSGGNAANAEKFFKANGLNDFYYGLGGPGRGGSWGVRGLGGGVAGERASVTNYPAECYLPIRTPRYGGERVIDFSNPLTIKLERERAFTGIAGQEKMTGRAEMDFADYWDKWPGQYDPYMSALETYRAGGMPWREVVDQKAPRMVIRSNMNVIDHSYGLVDICRISEDADGGYEQGLGWDHWFTVESVIGASIRAFYSGRVFWNDLDGLHVYKFKAEHATTGTFDYGQAKVSANFHAMVGNTILVSEAFDVSYPANRIELLKRISPPTPDVSYPVDLFVRKPAQVFNMPVERPFGTWDVLSVFNYSNEMNKWSPTRINPTLLWQLTLNPSDGWPDAFTARLDAAKDLRLDPAKEYIAYEFWTKELIGTFKGSFQTRPLNAYDCDIYSIVEKQDRPVLISTSRHVRQMAFDIKNLAWDGQQRVLRGTSRAVAGDPYQLRIYVPDGYAGKRVELSEGLTGTMNADARLLTVDYRSSTGKDVEWKVFF